MQAFFLEDVLVQTRYLEGTSAGAEGGGRGGGAGLLGGYGATGLEGDGEDAYDCALCGKSGFRCVRASASFFFVPCAYGNTVLKMLHARLYGPYEGLYIEL